mgnify:CR=1 FL=1|jgi:hypothetical protein
MKSDVIYTNQTIRIKARIRDIDGALTNPQSIEFELEKPGEASYSAFTTLSTPAIVNESTGIYYIDLDVDMIGKWKYSWFTYGNVTSSWKGFFQVEDARYV